jgi:tetratricopeptide (TPR) repeat protein
MRADDAHACHTTRRRKTRHDTLLGAVYLAVFSLAAAWPLRGPAAEQAEEFLNGLKQRGLAELALNYLEGMETSALASDEFRRKIPYHRGVVLIELSRQSADPAARSRLLDEARTALEKFAGSDAQSVQAAEAQLQLASIQMERGQQLLAQAKKLPNEPVYDDQRRALSQEARAHFAGARETFESAAIIYSAELDKLPPAAVAESDGDTSSRRQEYRTRVAQLRFLSAQTHFETAQSYPADDDEFHRLHEAAAKELSAIFDEFARSGSSIVGLYARLYEGRCYQALGEYQMALGCYEDILVQPNVLPAFRKLIASAVHRKAEVLLAQEKIAEAIELCSACLKDAAADEQRMPEWLAVRFRLGQAFEKRATDSPSGSSDHRRLLAEARDAFRLVAAVPSEFQTDARLAVGELARGNGGTKDEPTTFRAAYDLGKDALASYNAAKLALPTAEKNNPTAIAELQAQMDQGKQDARHYFRIATTLIEDDTDPSLVTEVRYFLCWLYWEAGDFYRSAALGEFLARRYPDHAAASSAAKLSMASYERLYTQAASTATNSASNADTEFEARRMANMAEFITRRWPGTPDADAAFGVLVSYAIRTSRIEEAERLLAEASDQSRPRLELQLGNALWGRFLELSQARSTQPQDSAALEALKKSALKYLRGGLDYAATSGETSESAAMAALYLAQAHLSDGQFDQAISLLEDPQRGPLTLIAQEHSVADSPQYVMEAYKAAVRAYILITPPQEQKAIDAMKSLEQAVQSRTSGGGEAAQQLTRIYVALGVALQKQIDELAGLGRSTESKQLTDAFTKFLERIAARPSEMDWPTGAWVAQSYLNLSTSPQRAGSGAQSRGDGRATAIHEPPSKPAAGPARDYLVKARRTYEQLLSAASSTRDYAPDDNAVLAAKVQLGDCYRGLGEYQKALDMFSDILKGREASLTVQRAAAYTYQQRGETEDPKWFERAIHGGYTLRSTGQNRIWGWLKISQVAARAARSDEKYRDTFYEARLNVARCRYLSAMKSSGTTRAENLTKAQQSIQSLARLYPDLGGEAWRGQFQALLKQIQSAING